MEATIVQKKLKREKEIGIILDNYVAKWNAGTDYEISLIDDAAKKVTDTYFDIHTNVIKPYLLESSKSNRFKVASGTEFACIFVKPITSVRMNTVERKEMNALFSAHAAMSMLFSISFDLIKFNSSNEADVAKVRVVLVEHIKWLSTLNTQHTHLHNIPTYLNSNFWQVVSELMHTLDIGITPRETDLDF
jgi:hypothetical protein